jgi:hypothetical protein
MTRRVKEMRPQRAQMEHPLGHHQFIDPLARGLGFLASLPA